MRRAAVLAAALAAAAPTGAQGPGADHGADARALDRLVAENYAYLDRFPGGAAPDSDRLRARRDAVRTRSDLLRYAEDRLAALADDHAIAGDSRSNSWAVAPSFADLWVEARDGAYPITAVRAGSPAAAAGLLPGDRLVAVGGAPIGAAVAGWWAELGLAVDPERAGHAARVLAAGRRDRPRVITVARGGAERTLTLPNLYGSRRAEPLVDLSRTARGTAVIRFGNSLGDGATVAAFDAVMARLRPREPVVLDLTETPGGGNTSVARGIMGWFTDRPAAYQIHERPAEERATGVARRWVEQVLPRAGKRHRGRVTVRVGRWTGSMGEGLAVGLHALGAKLCGERMAGLRGSIEDFRLPSSGLVVKLPTERLYAVDGTPREAFPVKRRCPGG